jgi:hypothetical protein
MRRISHLWGLLPMVFGWLERCGFVRPLVLRTLLRQRYPVSHRPQCVGPTVRSAGCSAMQV